MADTVSSRVGAASTSFRVGSYLSTDEGENLLRVEALDTAGNGSSQDFTVRRDSVAPVIALAAREVTVSGRVDEVNPSIPLDPWSCGLDRQYALCTQVQKDACLQEHAPGGRGRHRVRDS